MTIPLTIAAAEPPAPATDDEIEQAPEDLIEVSGELIRGETVTIQLAPEWVGASVSVWLHSEPILLSDGLQQVDANGQVTVTVPADAPKGKHRLVVLDEDGAVISWTEVRIKPVKGGPKQIHP